MTRKRYNEYKDGLPVLDLTAAKLKAITDKHFCVKANVNIDGKRTKIRVRLKPAKKLTLTQEVKLLRMQVRKLQKGA